MNSTTDILMTPEEVAKYISRTTSALAQLRYRGTGPRFIRVGGRIRYRIRDVEEWLTSGERDRT